MNWDALGAIGEIIGAIAVVATLAYLAQQIRYSSKIATAQMVKDAKSASSNLLNVLATDPDLTRSYIAQLRPDQDPADIDTELERTRMLLLSAFQLYEWQYYAQREGLFDDTIAGSYDRIVRDHLQSHTIRKWWLTSGEPVASEPFAEYVSGIIDEIERG